jgi:hypothetical protein
LLRQKKKRNPQVALNPPMEEGGDDNVAKAQGGGEGACDGTDYAAGIGAVQYEYLMPRSLFHMSKYISLRDNCCIAQSSD